jgi:hypothetical protein
MGCTTEFFGEVAISPPLNEAERRYLQRFAKTRRMDRKRGPYYVDGSGPYGQGNDPDIPDHNCPPQGQPGLWCEWVPSEDGSALEWDGGEKLYKAVPGMAYLIDHFLRAGAKASRSQDPQFAEFTFDHFLNGEIEARGEEPDDKWLLRVRANGVSALPGRIVYE